MGSRERLLVAHGAAVRRASRESRPGAALTGSERPSAGLGVAIAACGRQDALRRCVEAVAAGDVVPTEIVVVDQDASEDAARTTRQAAGRVPVRYLPQARTGLSASRNAALAALASEIIAVTDDDCVPDRGWLAAISRAFAGAPGAVAVTGPVLPLPAVDERRFAVSSRVGEVRREFSGRVAPWLVGTGANCAFRRDPVGRVGGYDERLGAGSRGRAGEDLDLIDRLLAAGGTIVYEPRALVRHERQTRSRRRATRSAYGHGVGAWAGVKLRQRDLHAGLHLLRWIALRARLLGRALVRREAESVVEELHVLGGTARGLLYGMRARR